MSQFTIDIDGNEIEVLQLETNTFRVRLPEKTIHLIKKEDDEGASHWFEEGKDNETPQLIEIGTAIETWLLSH
ncbi:hypothetical protein DVR12_21005 [Chitinophaga silvatica]|uniref:Uncharacterized protein n=1 Tax=Chitinophaga silvatica TaxID=2282649 RepID=A0A3E1Y6L2_9BACT|nr:hypothetical protein [Chitinophaga silvatica]RFS20197.1 hypothetical protein DVR12_21005 [Chitinophaga silvatica]